MRSIYILELAEYVVVLCVGTLTLEDLDEDTGLVVGVCGESLGLLGVNGGVALDECSQDTTKQSRYREKERERGRETSGRRITRVFSWTMASSILESWMTFSTGLGVERKRVVEVEERVNFNGGLCSRRERTLGTRMRYGDGGLHEGW